MNRRLFPDAYKDAVERGLYKTISRKAFNATIDVDQRNDGRIYLVCLHHAAVKGPHGYGIKGLSLKTRSKRLPKSLRAKAVAKLGLSRKEIEQAKLCGWETSYLVNGKGTAYARMSAHVREVHRLVVKEVSKV